MSRPFKILKYASFTHSLIYTALLVSAISGSDDSTYVLGWLHGVGWILMSIACLTAVQLRIIPLKVAAAVVILGGIGPFFGSWMFIREQRQQEWVG